MHQLRERGEKDHFNREFTCRGTLDYVFIQLKLNGIFDM